MKGVEAVFGAGWLVFWLGWLVAAVSAKGGRSRWQGRHAGVRVVIAVVVVLLLRLRVLHSHPVHSPWLAGVGLAMFVLGLALAVWARVHLGHNWGTPMSEKDDPELVTTGPYRWIRNPIYSGIILAMIGTAVAISVYWLAVVALAGGYFVYSAFVEQRYMASRFPDTYPAYQRSTKMLVPFVF
jgi:protein-S-isoprenylcysteine O-methyltransferase Ste14